MCIQRGIKMKYYVGIDLGGTNIAAGIVSDTGELLNKMSVKTNADRHTNEIIEDMEKLCFAVIEDMKLTREDISGVGIGSAGRISGGVILSAGNLGFKNVEMEKIFSEKTGFKTAVCNDANAVALAEAKFGAGKGVNNLVAVTIGTGIGGGVIVGGKIVEGINGGAGEVGHMIINPKGNPCCCGNVGCFEAHCSATALINSTKKAMNENPDSSLWKYAPSLDDVDGRTVFSAMKDGDESAVKVFEKYTYDFAVALEILVAVLQPDVICIGGGMSAEGDTIINPIIEKLRANPFCNSPYAVTKIKAAELKNGAGIIGAAYYAVQKIEE